MILSLLSFASIALWASDRLNRMRVHPFLLGVQSQQDLSATASSFVNEAFQTLKDPLKRGEYMVSPSSSMLTVAFMDHAEPLLALEQSE